MSRILFRGIMPALITPFDENRQVKKEAVKALMDYQYSKGVKGFYINGSTGEGPAIAPATRMEMAETVVESNQIPASQGIQMRLSVSLQGFQIPLQCSQIFLELHSILRIPLR